MEFKNKLKTRLYLAICYILLGVTMTIVFNVMENPNEYLSTFGLVLAVIGIPTVLIVVLIVILVKHAKKRKKKQAESAPEQTTDTTTE